MKVDHLFVIFAYALIYIFLKKRNPNRLEYQTQHNTIEPKEHILFVLVDPVLWDI